MRNLFCFQSVVVTIEKKYIIGEKNQTTEIQRKKRRIGV